MATFAERLDALRPVMQEAGLQRQWRELKTFANGALAGYTGTVGAIDYVTDLTPDAVETFTDEVNTGALAARTPQFKPTAGFRES